MKSRYYILALIFSAAFLAGFPHRAPADSGANVAAKTASKADLQAWQKAITAAPSAGNGCYKLEYPSRIWTKVDCGAPPAKQPRTLGFNQFPGKRRPNVPTLPLSGDWIMTPTNTISLATGTITALTNVTSAGSLDSNHQNAYAANVFSLQINSNSGPGLTASTGKPSCAQSTNKTSCYGWIQYVYNSESNQLYVQFWLLGYLTATTTSCPPGFPLSDKGQAGTPQVDCGINVASANNLPSSLNNFAKMQGATLSGQLLSNSKVIVTFTVAGTAYRATGKAIGGATGATWTSAEFNIFGAGGFGSGTSAKIYQTVQLNTAAEVSMQLTSDNDTSGKSPTCPTTPASFTFENSNMFLGPCNTGLLPKPGIFFNESPMTPKITSVSPAQGRVAGGTSVQLLGGPFNQQVQILFTNALGSQIVPPTNTLPNDVTVATPAGTVGLPDSITAAYIFPNGYPGPFGPPAPTQFTYYATPGCNFSGFFCPFNENQPPSYTATCGTPTDFYTTTDTSPADFNLQLKSALTYTGPSVEETQLLAACEAGSKTQCDFYSTETFTKCTKSGGGGGGGTTCTKCGGEKCCPNPNGKGDICVPQNVNCPVLQ